MTPQPPPDGAGDERAFVVDTDPSSGYCPCHIAREACRFPKCESARSRPAAAGEQTVALLREARVTIGTLLSVIEDADDSLLDSDMNASCHREGKRVYALIAAAIKEAQGHEG